MNQIIKSFLTTHIKEYGLEKIKESTAFEHFINRIIINKPELFTPVPDNRLNTGKTLIKMKNGLSPKR